MNRTYYSPRDYVPYPGINTPDVREEAVLPKRAPTGAGVPSPRPILDSLAALAQLTDSASLADAIEAIGGRASMHGPHCFDDGVPVCGFPEYHR